MADTDENEDYDYEDFEDYDHESPSNKRKGTPHSSKKSPKKAINWEAEDENEEQNAAEQDEASVEGQDLESYMKQYSGSDNLDNANMEDLACELKPLDGVRPKMDDAEEEQLLHKLGYDRSYSNNSSPVKGRSIKVLTNNSSPSPSNGGPRFLSLEEEFVLNYQESMKIAATAMSDENPSTNTSKDNKTSPVPINPTKSFHGAQKVGFSLDRQSGKQDEEGDSAESGADKLLTRKSASENYMSSFKSLIETSSPKSQANKIASPKSPNAADLVLMTKKPTAESERENAERVDALLMELFPERYEKQQQQQQKKGKGKGTKKAAAPAAVSTGTGIAAFNKNQVYGLAAQRAPLGSVDSYHYGSANSSALQDDDGDTQVPLMASLDQQLKLLKRELKAKDDKITRLTEHAVMMGTHMDKLKGEAAYLTMQLREANMELEAKEGRLQEALKARKKLKKAAAAGGGGSGGGADLAVVEHENQRLREREQALMDAIEELSSQNEDLIQKLKESMERELVLSSKRAAQISHNVSALSLSEQQQHSQSQYHLPQIAGSGAGSYAQGPRAEAGLRTQSEPTAEVPKRRKKKSL